MLRLEKMWTEVREIEEAHEAHAPKAKCKFRSELGREFALLVNRVGALVRTRDA